jgi:NADH dehydrogenase
MIGLDRKGREIHLAATFDDEGEEITPKRSFTYDTLVIAVGSVSNDFGTPGVRKHAIMLETPEHAARFNRKIVNACFRAHTQAQPVQPGQLHVTIIGAGATGTELSAELHQSTRAVVAYGLDKINPSKDIRITLVEGADRILPALPESVSHSTAVLLKGLEVDVRTGAKVNEVSNEGVHLESGELIPSKFVVWAAGVRGPDFLSNLDGLEVSRSNQLVVLPTLQTTLDPDIFAIGDCASCLNSASGQPVPPAPRRLINRLPISSIRLAAGSKPSHCNRTSTGILARWCRSASMPLSVISWASESGRIFRSRDTLRC